MTYVPRSRSLSLAGIRSLTIWPYISQARACQILAPRVHLRCLGILPATSCFVQTIQQQLTLIRAARFVFRWKRSARVRSQRQETVNTTGQGVPPDCAYVRARLLGLDGTRGERQALGGPVCYGCTDIPSPGATPHNRQGGLAP
eukprot:3663022-Prymnesium_polylepis.2